jgi:hypothetical protein
MDYQNTFKKQGITYTKKQENNASVCYECKLYDSTWWEVWQKRKSVERSVKLGEKIVTYRGGAIYPRNEEFGRYAYTVARHEDIDAHMSTFEPHKSIKEAE